jgi:acetyl-CoA carboxylase carboxyl transferase subunit alpha
MGRQFGAFSLKLHSFFILKQSDMDLKFLDFEQPIAELQAKIEELRKVEFDNNFDISETLKQLEDKCDLLTESIFSDLSDWQISQLSRHPGRPYTLDYISLIFTDFHELHGDRAFADDPAIVCGLARLEDQPVVVIGHQKGRDTKEKIHRNFGMPRPEGYRKALRVMRLAERFQLPIICLIDTPGAYPGIGAEERGQSEAIARNLFEMTTLKTPIICTVIGEGGSGGALAIGVGDRLLMLEYSTYAVISPEGCASILWKSADKAQLAAEAMGITSDRVREQGFLDEVVREPVGGGHRDFEQVSQNLKDALVRHLTELNLEAQNMDRLLDRRYQRIMRFGSFIEEQSK